MKSPGKLRTALEIKLRDLIKETIGDQVRESIKELMSGENYLELFTTEFAEEVLGLCALSSGRGRGFGFFKFDDAGKFSITFELGHADIWVSVSELSFWPEGNPEADLRHLDDLIDRLQRIRADFAEKIKEPDYGGDGYMVFPMEHGL